MESLNIVSIVTEIPNRSNTISLTVYCLIGTCTRALGLAGIYRFVLRFMMIGLAVVRANDHTVLLGIKVLSEDVASDLISRTHSFLLPVVEC
jgi:1-aminocyclopropane-1-carboxylate deaminase/D-cysteine desulfhydrase-like pyridoxal-dependent ACC family enzyme